MPGKDTNTAAETDPMLTFLGDEEGGDGGAGGSDAQDALVDQLAGEGGDDEGDEGAGETDGEGEGDGAGETDTEGEETGEAQGAAAELPPWSKPLQAVQQNVANASRELKETKSMLQRVLEKLDANPTAANNAAAAKVEEAKDALAEIEQELASSDFDTFEKSPALLKKLVGEIRSVREENKALKADVTSTTSQAKAAQAAEAGWKTWATSTDAGKAVGLKRGRELWDESLTEAQALDPELSGQQLQGAAKVLWSQKLKAEKTKTPATAGASTSTGKNLPRSGGTVAPKQGRTGGQAASAPTLEQDLERGKFGLDKAFR